jgi:carboxylesterase
MIEDNNEKEKIGILMLHGFTACPNQFDELSEFFSGKGFKILAPLMAGHGKTSKELRSASPEDWKKSVKDAYLDLKKDVDKIFIIGNSFGGNMAFWLAREFNNEQAGIVTLGAPIWLKYHKFILLRLNTYGLLRRYYVKPRRVYKSVWAFIKSLFFKKNYDLPWAPILCKEREIIPTKSFRYFLGFIKNDTKPNLDKVKIPVFITHSLSDKVVKPKSAEFIYENIGSEFKELYWFESNHHVILKDKKRIKLFKKIYSFISKLT